MARALLIEDDKAPHHTFTETLRGHGFTVFTASNQRDIFNQLDEASDTDTPFDVILTDDGLKCGNIRLHGIDIYNIIRCDSGLNTVPIIASSQDICLWEGIRCTNEDANLHVAVKVSHSGTLQWDDLRMLEILSKLNLLQSAPAA